MASVEDFAGKTRYYIQCRDNSDFGDSDYGASGSVYNFDSLEGAISWCKKSIDSSVDEFREGGMDAKEIFSRYAMWGEWSQVYSRQAGEDIEFNGWDYARLCAAGLHKQV